MFRKKIEDMFGPFLGVGVSTEVEAGHETKEGRVAPNYIT